MDTFPIQFTPEMMLAMPLVLLLVQIAKILPIPEKIDQWVHLIAPLVIGVVGVYLFSPKDMPPKQWIASGLAAGAMAGYGYDFLKQLFVKPELPK